MAARVTFPGSAVYCASKFGLRALADSLRKEVGKFGVRITDIQPGAVDTELPESVQFAPTRQALRSSGGFYAPDSPMLQAHDVAQAVLYALTQPDAVAVNEILLRPRLQQS